MVVNVILGEDWLLKSSIVTMVEGFSLMRFRAFKLVKLLAVSSAPVGEYLQGQEGVNIY